MKLNFWKNKKLFRKKLKKILGFKPGKLNLYQKAFIHKSATYSDHKGNLINNERLEYLGDAILDAVIADFLFKKFPNKNEGFLTKNRSKIVNTANLSEIAKKLKLEDFLLIKDEKSVSKKYICGDTVEALIGAIYLDKGFKQAYDFIIKKLLQYIDLKEIIEKEGNYKSRVLEYGQKEHLNVVFKTSLLTENPLLFKSQVFISNKLYGEGTGETKKDAEQNAAKIAFSKLKTSVDD